MRHSACQTTSADSNCRTPLRFPLPPAPRVFNTPLSAPRCLGAGRCASSSQRRWRRRSGSGRRARSGWRTRSGSRRRAQRRCAKSSPRRGALPSPLAFATTCGNPGAKSGTDNQLAGHNMRQSWYEIAGVRARLWPCAAARRTLSRRAMRRQRRSGGARAPRSWRSSWAARACSCSCRECPPTPLRPRPRRSGKPRPRPRGTTPLLSCAAPSRHLD